MFPFGVGSVRQERARREGSGVIVFRLPSVCDNTVESKMNEPGSARLDGCLGC